MPLTTPTVSTDAAKLAALRRVKLIAWTRLARAHPGWLWSDGTHLRPTGLPGYTQ